MRWRKGRRRRLARRDTAYFHQAVSLADRRLTEVGFPLWRFHAPRQL